MKRKILKILIVVAIIAIIVPMGALYWLTSDNFNSPLNDSIAKGMDNEKLRSKVSILLIGADQRGNDEKFNTDSIILATIDPKGPRISLLSIPRDTKVSLPRHPNIKINSVVPLTDIDTLQDVVSDLTGVPVSGYMLTNFDGFKDIIDTLGGITVDVEKDMYYETGDKEDGFINLKKGLQNLDGSKALQYARFRNDALADISRTARQQVVLKEVAKEMLQLSTIPKLPWLIPQLNNAIETNLSLGDLLKLSKTAMQFKDAEIVTQTLPGRFLDLNGISYWDVDPDEAKTIVSDLLGGVTTSKVVGESELDLLEPIIVDKTPLSPVSGSPLDPNGPESNEEPQLPEFPQVPGSPTDPNGNNSNNHEDFGDNENNEDNNDGDLVNGNPEGTTTGTNQGDSTDQEAETDDNDNGNRVRDQVENNIGNREDRPTGL